MSYKHIKNLYAANEIMMLRECYAMEKIHGSSAHIGWNGSLTFFAGGEKHVNFVAIFDQEKLKEKFIGLGHGSLTDVVIYGEVYGGKCQGMSATYGKQLKFIAFEVKIGESWLAVPQAEGIVTSFGLEFVHYRKISTDLASLDIERDTPSEQAFRNGCADRNDPTTVKKREGIVLRPLMELRMNNGERIISKHKREDFAERKHVPKVGDDLKLIADAETAANEFVTYMRLTHVLDKLGNPNDITRTGDVVKAMIEDVYREAAGEIVDNPITRRAVSRAAAKLYKDKISKIGSQNESA